MLSIYLTNDMANYIKNYMIIIDVNIGIAESYVLFQYIFFKKSFRLTKFIRQQLKPIFIS
jgi:hypothetical protein